MTVQGDLIAPIFQGFVWQEAWPSSSSNSHTPEIAASEAVSSTVAKVLNLKPELILGETHLFNYNAYQEKIELSSPFKKLLQFLENIQEVDSQVLEAQSLHALNAILQKQQDSGGLLRKSGVERWYLEDSESQKKYYEEFNSLLKELDFYTPKDIESPIAVDQCIVFGGYVKHMKTRIEKTLHYLKNGSLQVIGQIFLLGCSRSLKLDEIDYLEQEWLSQEKFKNYWNEIFDSDEKFTESNAFIFLWKCILPPEIQSALEDKLIEINSERIGHSYGKNEGYRVTTEVTVEDWMRFFIEKRPRTIFAVAEQPYGRLLDQLRLTILKKAEGSLEGRIDQIAQITFYVASPVTDSSIPVSLMLDEIGRNLYRVVETLDYLS